MSLFNFFHKKTINEIVDLKTTTLWREAAAKRTALTPDLNEVSLKRKHYVFVYDDMKIGFPRQSELGGTYDPYLNPVLTADDNYALWSKSYDHKPGTAVAVRLNTKSKRYDPRNVTSAGRIKGELHLIPTEELFRLDEKMANGLYFKREKIEVCLPYSDRRLVKIRITEQELSTVSFMADEFPNTVEAFAYIADKDFVDQEPYYSIKPTRMYSPDRRIYVRGEQVGYNSRYISRKPYYEFTKLDLNGK